MHRCGVFQVGNQLRRLADVLRKVGKPKNGEMVSEEKLGSGPDMAAKSPASKQKKRKDLNSKDRGAQNPKGSKKKQRVLTVAGEEG